MRPATLILVILAALAVGVAVWFATGGRFVFFCLPLLFGLPFLVRRSGKTTAADLPRDQI